jgi:hypothetical protein
MTFKIDIDDFLSLISESLQWCKSPCRKDCNCENCDDEELSKPCAFISDCINHAIKNGNKIDLFHIYYYMNKYDFTNRKDIYDRLFSNIVNMLYESWLTPLCVCAVIKPLEIEENVIIYDVDVNIETLHEFMKPICDKKIDSEL